MNGVIFGNKFSGEYGAIMNYARITPPSVKENYVDIAGGDSSIDLTEAVGGVAFEDGTIDFKFTLFDKKKKELMKNELHGKRMEIIIQSDPDFYYEGRVRCTSDEWVKGVYELCWTVQVKPYKYEKQITIHNDSVDGFPKNIYLQNTRMPVMPRIKVEGNIYLTYESIRYTLNTGVYLIPEITLYEGVNKIKLSGKGTIGFEYRRGCLI